MRPWVAPAVLIAAFLALISGIIFMPASELMPAQLQPGPLTPGLSPIRSDDMMAFFRDAGNSVCSGLQMLFPQFVEGDIKTTLSKPMQNDIPGEVKSYAIYAVFLAGAMILAAIAINVAGRWDSEEKTTIPIKK